MKLTGHQSCTAIFSLSQRWPLNAGLTIDSMPRRKLQTVPGVCFAGSLPLKNWIHCLKSNRSWTGKRLQELLKWNNNHGRNVEVQISPTKHYIIFPLTFILKCHVHIGRTKMDPIPQWDDLNIFLPNSMHCRWGYCLKMLVC
jgi:hypothetical protein